MTSTITTLSSELSALLRERFCAAFPDSPEAAAAGRVTPSAKPGFGDWQCSDALQLARSLHMPPKTL